MLAASEQKLADAERRVQEFWDNKDTMDDLTTRAEEDEANVKSSDEQFHFIEDKVSEQSS